MKSAPLVFSACLICFAVVLVSGSPGGAPKAACADMKPRHGQAKAQDASTNPYSVMSEKNGDGTYSVSVEGDKFEGVLIRAEDPDTNNYLAGTFTSDGNTRTLDCAATADAITHKDKNAKRKVTVQWRGRQEDKVPSFVATVVKKKEVFWVKSAESGASAGMAGNVGVALLVTSAALAASFMAI